MNGMRALRHGAVVVIAGVLSAGGQSKQFPTSGNPPIQQTSPGIPSMGRDPMSVDPLGPRVEAMQIRTRNTERQKKIVADTDRLLGIATQLKQEMDKSEKAAPADMTHKAEEIEKLAKSVKDKMKG